MYEAEKEFRNLWTNVIDRILKSLKAFWNSYTLRRKVLLVKGKWMK